LATCGGLAELMILALPTKKEEIDSLRRNNAALVEKAKKYRSEARAADVTQPKERERSASIEPVKRKAPAPVEAVQEPMEEEGDDEEPAEVAKPAKKAVRACMRRVGSTVY